MEGVYKAVGVVGSPRKDSNTEFFMNTVLKKLEDHGVETELVTLGDKEITDCTACYKCWQDGETVGMCQLETDDDFEEVYKKLEKADAIVVGSSVNFSSVHSKLWSLLTRTGFPNYTTDTFSRKIGGPITVARRAGENFAFAQLLLWFFINDFIIPGSSYWNVGIAGSGAARDADQDEEGIGIMERFADNIFYLLEKTIER